MYHRYFGMKHRPFGATPQTGLCYPAAAQEEALATLQYAISQGRGVAVVTGVPGTGKTLVCHRLATALDPAFTTAMITNTHMPTVKGLLQAILYDLSVPYHGLDEQELRLTLTDFLLGKYAGGGRMVLIIDEAHNLAIALLEELRMLSNLEGESDKLFQIVLAGHPRLTQLLRTPELETLSQRIGARAVLGPMGDEESVTYIQYQLECAGVRPENVMSYDAMMAVADATGGIPRLINQLCDHSLLRAYAAEQHLVDVKIVMQAKSDLDSPTDMPIASPRTLQRAVAVVDEPLPIATDRNTTPDAPVADNPETFVACTECMGAIESVAINTGELVADSDRMLAINNSMNCVQAPATRLNREFLEEEIVVDPYAKMDAARSAALTNAARKSDQFGSPMRTAAVARTKPASANELPAPSSGTYDAITKTNSAQPVMADPFSSDALFVDAADNPAVHEVGAGILEAPKIDSDAPVLVIETRQQRAGGQIARVDTPQQSGRDSRGYRRLFTHARKS